MCLPEPYSCWVLIVMFVLFALGVVAVIVWIFVTLIEELISEGEISND